MKEMRSGKELHLRIYAAAVTLICGLLVWQHLSIPEEPAHFELLEARKDSGSPTERLSVTENVFAKSEFMARGLFFGKLADDANVLKIFDENGKQRLTLQFSSDGPAKLDFMNESGEIVYSLPEDKSRKTVLLGEKEAINH
jgi:hypothetical protein